MVSEFERMGDLSVHVAKIARLRVPEIAVPKELEPTISRMATIAEVMVGRVEHIIAERDVEGARALEEADEEMDRLRRSSFRELLGADWAHGVEPAIDIALLGRYYERIADHAVSIARRVVFLVTGEINPPPGRLSGSRAALRGLRCGPGSPQMRSCRCRIAARRPHYSAFAGS